MSNDMIGLPENDRPECLLVGTDGNVFSIIVTVGAALKKAGFRDKVDEWENVAFSANSYDEVLTLLHKYVKAQ